MQVYAGKKIPEPRACSEECTNYKKYIKATCRPEALSGAGADRKRNIQYTCCMYIVQCT